MSLLRSLLIVLALCNGGCYDFSRYERIPSLCDHSVDGQLFCDGFESEDAARVILTENGTAAIDRTHAYRGDAALHLSIGMGAGLRRAERLRSIVPMSAPFTAQRAFFYLPSAPPKHTRLLTIEQNGAPFSGIHLGVSATMELTRLHKPVSGSDDRATSARLLPLSKWVCLEVRIGWGTAGTVEVLMDDERIDDLALTADNVAVPPVDTSVTGLYFVAPPEDAYELWIDEHVIATQPIGCDR